MGGMAKGAIDRSAFDQRLGRIRDGGPNTMGKMLVGPGEEIRAKDARKAQARMKKEMRKSFRRARGLSGGDFIAFPLAIAMGAIAVVAGRIATWQFLTPGGPLAERITLPEKVAVLPLPLFADLAIAAVLALMLAWAFSFATGLKRLGVVLGFGAMISGEAFLIQRFPDVFANFYQQEFIASASAQTISFPIF